jgi:hypothetical protein
VEKLVFHATPPRQNFPAGQGKGFVLTPTALKSAVDVPSLQIKPGVQIFSGTDNPFWSQIYPAGHNFGISIPFDGQI